MKIAFRMDNEVAAELMQFSENRAAADFKHVQEKPANAQTKKKSNELH